MRGVGVKPQSGKVGAEGKSEKIEGAVFNVSFFGLYFCGGGVGLLGFYLSAGRGVVGVSVLTGEQAGFYSLAVVWGELQACCWGSTRRRSVEAG